MKTFHSASRRAFLKSTTSIAGALAVGSTSRTHAAEAPARTALFNSRDLSGWHAVPRLYVPSTPEFAKLPPEELKAAVVKWHEARADLRPRLKHTGRWEVIDGAIVGGQEPPGSGLGCYLISDETFADFELTLEARPDWPVDTGIMLRAHELGAVGFQVLVDHRPNGGIGGMYGNSIGGFHAAPFSVIADKQPGFRVTNLREGEQDANFEHPAMNYAATFADFAKVWHANDWNQFRIRCVGRIPVITTWINGLKICELDAAKIQTKGYDAEAVARRLGRAGHIGFEVHDVNLKHPLGLDRWAPGAVCRWRNILLSEV